MAHPTKIELMQRQAVLQGELNKLTALIDGMVDGSTRKPEVYDIYYYVDENFDVAAHTWVDNIIDNSLFSVGNVFLEEAAAKKEANHRALYMKLKRLAGGYKFKCGVMNWQIWYTPETDTIDVMASMGAKCAGGIYFESEEKAFAAVNEIGEKNIKAFFQ